MKILSLHTICRYTHHLYPQSSIENATNFTVLVLLPLWPPRVYYKIGHLHLYCFSCLNIRCCFFLTFSLVFPHFFPSEHQSQTHETPPPALNVNLTLSVIRSIFRRPQRLLTLPTTRQEKSHNQATKLILPHFRANFSTRSSFLNRQSGMKHTS